MSAFSLLTLAVATVSVVVALAGLRRRRPKAATSFFFAGMLSVLADRVSGAFYTREDLQLLQCIADQMTNRWSGVQT